MHGGTDKLDKLESEEYLCPASLQSVIVAQCYCVNLHPTFKLIKTVNNAVVLPLHQLLARSSAFLFI